MNQVYPMNNRTAYHWVVIWFVFCWSPGYNGKVLSCFCLFYLPAFVSLCSSSGSLIFKYIEYRSSLWHQIRHSWYFLPFSLHKGNKWGENVLEKMPSESRINIDLLTCYLRICPRIYLPCNNTCALTSRIIVFPSTVWNISKPHLEEQFIANMERQPRASNLMVVWQNDMNCLNYASQITVGFIY